MNEGGENQQLETKRFIIHENPLAQMKVLRETLECKKAEIPYLAGFGFFGSKTKGIETKDSDTDICIFIDSSKYSSFFGNAYTDIRKRIPSLIPPEYHPGTGIIDISPQSIKDSWLHFAQYAQPFINRGIALDPEKTPMDVVAPFFLSVGDGVYEARHEIFDFLRELPNGEILFRESMKSLGLFERKNREGKPAVPPYMGYPTTLAEGESYFIHREEQKQDARETGRLINIMNSVINRLHK